MYTSELADGSGITILRGLIDPLLVYAVDRECRELFTDELAARPPDESDKALQVVHLAGDLIQDPSSATGLALRLLEVTDFLSQVSVNYLPAGSKQPFHLHGSNVKAPVRALHIGNDGYFAYSLGARSREEAEEKHKRVGLRAGDVVLQEYTDQWHRDQNDGYKPIITLNIPTRR